MNYNINHAVFGNAFTIPADVADKYLRFCKGEHLKVLIYILRNSHQMPSVTQISSQTDVSEYDVKEALLFWADAGLLVCENPVNEEKTKSVKRNLRPSREDITKRGLEDPKLQYLLAQAQMILGRNLKGNEMETFGWLYEDLGLEVSVVLFVIQYAKQIGKANIRFIESLATDWVDKGVENIADAEEQVRLLALSEQAWRVVSNAFGIERRKPSKKEAELSVKWIDEWKIGTDLLKEAYDICVDTKSKFIFSYVAKLIENWHNEGYKKPQDIKQKTKIDKMQGAYDIDLFEKMINSKD